MQAISIQPTSKTYYNLAIVYNHLNDIKKSYER